MGRRSKREPEERERDLLFIYPDRFAYDIFVFTAQKLGVPRNCIGRSSRDANNYEQQDFVPAIFKVFIRTQESIRSICNAYFQELRKNKPISFESVANVWLETYCRMKHKRSDYFLNLPLSLAIGNELIQFLYSENSENLYVVELSQLWNDWFMDQFARNKKVGGIGELYEMSQTLEYLFDDYFNDKYIPIKFVPYAESARNPDFEMEMKQLREEHRKEIEANASVSGGTFWKNPGLGILPHEELIRFFSTEPTAEEIPSQPEACLPRTGRRGKKLSSKELHESIKHGLHPSVKQSPKKSTVDPSTEELPSEKEQSVTETHPEHQSRIQHGAIPKKPLRHRRESSGEQTKQKSKCSSSPSMEPAVPQLRLDSPEGGQPSGIKPSVTETQHETLSQSQTGAIPKDPVRRRRRSSGKKKTKDSSVPSAEQANAQLIASATHRDIQAGTITQDLARHPQQVSGKMESKDSSCPSAEQFIAQLSLSSPEGGQSSKKSPSVSGKHRDIRAEVISEDPAKYPGGSSSNQGNQRNLRSPSLAQGISPPSLRSKQASEKEQSQRVTPSQNVPTTSHQEPGKKHSQSSSHKKRQKKKSR